MPILILIVSAVGGLLWWWIRSNPREAIDVAQDAVTTIRNAPRRLAFRRQTNEHPVEGIDDPNIAIVAIAQAFIELDDLPTKDTRQQLNVAIRSKLRISAEECEEMEVLGRWLIEHCNGPRQAISRLGRRLYKLDGGASWDVLQKILTGLVSGELSQSQMDGIEDLKLALKR